jgi:hypothetical protein
MECLLVKKINDSDVWSIKRKNLAAEVRYNSKTQSLRILAEEKSVFFLERVGLLRSRIVIKSEYGQNEGEVSFSSMRQGGTIQIHQRKYNFQYDKGSLQLLDDRQQPLVTLNEKVIKDIDLFELASLLFAALILSDNSVKAVTATT